MRYKILDERTVYSSGWEADQESSVNSSIEELTAQGFEIIDVKTSLTCPAQTSGDCTRIVVAATYKKPMKENDGKPM